MWALLVTVISDGIHVFVKSTSFCAYCVNLCRAVMNNSEKNLAVVEAMVHRSSDPSEPRKKA